MNSPIGSYRVGADLYVGMIKFGHFNLSEKIYFFTKPYRTKSVGIL